MRSGVALFLLGPGLLCALRLLRAYTNQPEANRKSDERVDVQPATRFHACYFLRISDSMISTQRSELPQLSLSIHKAGNIVD
jgi:hypothetical protein